LKPASVHAWRGAWIETCSPSSASRSMKSHSASTRGLKH
jgi:hypothetical protein